MRVRDASPEDAASLGRLRYGPRRHVDRIRDAADGTNRYLLVEEADEVLGFGVLVLEQPPGWPLVRVLPQGLDLFVQEKRRSQGIGRLLLERMEHVVQEADGIALYLCVDPEANPRALALYLRRGYVQIDDEAVEETWSFVDSGGETHEGTEQLVRLRKPLPSQRKTIRPHDGHLHDGDLTLRPMTEEDWPVLLPWNQDPEVLFHAEGDEVEARTLAEIQAIYRGVSRAARVFVMELAGRPIGECWLQEMNLPRILARFPWDARLQRIDMMIGEKDHWGRGLGTRGIRLLLRHAFQVDHADAVFGCDVSASNPRSDHTIRQCGFVPFLEHDAPKGKARDFVLTREVWNRG